MSDRKYFVDLPMLDRFTAYHREQLKMYADMLSAILNAFCTLFDSTINDKNMSIEAAVAEADSIADTLEEDDSYGTGNEYLLVNDFLNGLRCGLISKGWRYQGIDFRNDHSMVETAIMRAALKWQDLRIQHGDDANSVVKIFAEDIGSRFPDVNTLYALLAAEYAKAREILLVQPEPPRSA